MNDDTLAEELRDKQITRRVPFMNLAFVVTNCTINSMSLWML